MDGYRLHLFWLLPSTYEMLAANEQIVLTVIVYLPKFSHEPAQASKAPSKRSSKCDSCTKLSKSEA